MGVKVSIIGVGLIGGSLAKALKKAGGYEVTGIVRNKNENAEKCCDILTDNILDGVKNADIIVFATPLSTYSKYAEEIAPYINENQVITDVGSVKEKPAEILGYYFKEDFIVPAHPIAGKAISGAKEAESGLYKNKKVILTPLTNSKNDNIIKVSKMWEDVGGNIEILSAKKHDKIYAAVSHSVQLLSFVLEDYIQETKAEIKESEKVNESLRLRTSPEVMWEDIFAFNQKAVSSYIKKMLEADIEWYQENTGIDKDFMKNMAAWHKLFLNNEYLSYAGTGLKSFYSCLDNEKKEIKLPNKIRDLLTLRLKFLDSANKLSQIRS